MNKKEKTLPFQTKAEGWQPALLEACFQSSKLPIAVQNQHGRYTRVSQALADLLAAKPEELLEKSDRDLFGERWGHTFKRDLQRLSGGEAVDIPEIRLKRGSKHITLSLTKTPITADTILVTARDKTREYQLEQDLTRQTTLLENIINLSPSTITVRDEDGTMIVANNQAARQYGYGAPEALLGQDPAGSTNQKLKEDELKVINSEREEFVPEMEIPASSGQQPRTQRVWRKPIVIARDTVIDPYLEFVFDQERRYKEIHAVTDEILVAPRDVLLGNKYADFIPKPIARQIDEAIDEIYQEGGPISFEYTLPLGERSLTFKATLTGMMGGGDIRFRVDEVKPNAVITFAEDITELKRAVSEAEEQRRKAIDAARSKDIFLATMSHELRTPLNAIIGFAGLLLVNPDSLNEQQKLVLPRILDNGSRLLSLINNLLDLSRISAGRLEITPVDVETGRFVANFENDLGVHFKDKPLVNFTVRSANPLPHTIHQDPERIAQIVNNLVGNAAKFTDSGDVKLTFERKDERLVIEVSDTGPGIPRAKQDIIFDQFTQIDSSSTRKHGGAGLGLSIVKQLAMLMGGTIRLHSEVGKGSTFTVSLPLNLDPNPRSKGSALELIHHKETA